MTDEPLSERERAVATLLAHGLRNEDAAHDLGVSLRTVEADRARLMRKLGLKRRHELVHWALERGLLR